MTPESLTGLTMLIRLIALAVLLIGAAVLLLLARDALAWGITRHREGLARVRRLAYGPELDSETRRKIGRWT